MTENTIEHMTIEYKKQLIKYLFLCILSEGSKILLFSIIFLRIHLFSEFLFSIVLLILLRTNGGGLHFKHYASCLVVSFLIILGSITLGIYFPIENLTLKTILIIFIFLGYWCVPVISGNRPPASDRLIKKSKRNTIVILVTYLTLICIIPTNRYFNIGIWIIIIHIFQLLLAKFTKRRKNKCGTH